MGNSELKFYVSDIWKSAPIGTKARWLIEKSDEQRKIRNNENNKNKQYSKDSGSN